MKGRDKLVTPRDEFFLLKILTSRKMAVTTHDSPSQRLQNQTLWIDLKKTNFGILGVALSLSPKFIGKNMFRQVREFDALTVF